jgi:hypothetical protein
MLCNPNGHIHHAIYRLFKTAVFIQMTKTTRHSALSRPDASVILMHPNLVPSLQPGHNVCFEEFNNSWQVASN